jgi:hypothetical protein
MAHHEFAGDLTLAYDRRISELPDGLKKVTGDDQHAAGVLADGIDRYRSIRSRALDDLVDLIEHWSAGNTGLRDRWQDRVNRARADMESQFGNSAKDLLMQGPVQSFWDGTVRFERQFFEGLLKVETPDFAEKLVAHRATLTKTISDLTTNWKDLLSADKGMLDDETNTVKQLDELVQGLAEDIERRNRAIVAEFAVKLKEGVASAVDRARDKVREAIGDKATDIAEGAIRLALTVIKDQLIEIPPGAEPAVEAEQEAIRQGVERDAYFSKAYRDLAAQYRQLMSIQEGGVLTMYRKTRDQVMQYRQTANLATAQIWRDQAKRQLTDWAGAGVGAQRDDAAEFNGKIFEVVDDRFKDISDLDHQFRDKFVGVFTTPPTPETIEQLTEEYKWRQAIDAVNGRGILAKINNAKEQLGGMLDTAVEQAAQPLDQMDTDWPDELKDAAGLSRKHFRQYVQDRLKSQIDLAINSLGELGKFLDPPRIQADFSREQLEAMLKS